VTRHDRTIFEQLWALLGVQLSSELSSPMSVAVLVVVARHGPSVAKPGAQRHRSEVRMVDARPPARYSKIRCTRNIWPTKFRPLAYEPVKRFKSPVTRHPRNSQLVARPSHRGVFHAFLFVAQRLIHKSVHTPGRFHMAQTYRGRCLQSRSR
jgi:hypothetical protein